MRFDGRWRSTRMPDVIEQLRRYGEAVERYALSEPSDPVAGHPIARRPVRRHVARVTAMIAVGAIAVAAVVQFWGHGRAEIRSKPAAGSGRAVLVATRLP